MPSAELGASRGSENGESSACETDALEVGSGSEVVQTGEVQAWQTNSISRSW